MEMLREALCFTQRRRDLGLRHFKPFLPAEAAKDG